MRNEVSIAEDVKCLGNQEPKNDVRHLEMRTDLGISEFPPEVISSLREVISAFVDLGFEVSPFQQVKRPHNTNSQILALAEEFAKSAA